MRQQANQKNKSMTQNRKNKLDEPIESLIVDNEAREKLTPFLYWIKEHCAKWVFDLVRRIYEYFANSQINADDSLKAAIKNDPAVNNISQNNSPERSPKLDQVTQEKTRY